MSFSLRCIHIARKQNAKKEKRKKKRERERKKKIKVKVLKASGEKSPGTVGFCHHNALSIWNTTGKFVWEENKSFQLPIIIGLRLKLM